MNEKLAAANEEKIVAALNKNLSGDSTKELPEL